MVKCLVMNSEYSSMGRWVSLIVADALHMNFYETRDLLALSGEDWLTEEVLFDFENRMVNMLLEDIKKDEMFLSIHKAISNAISKAVSLGPCIIHESGAMEILKKNNTGYVNVMLYNTNLEKRMERSKLDTKLQLESSSKEEIIEIIMQEDNKRKVYHNAVSNSLWGDKETYDLCLDSEKLGREKCAEILIEALKEVTLDEEKCKEIILSKFEKVM